MVNYNEDTEFNDALRAHGIIPPKAPFRSPSPDIPHLTHTDAIQAIASTADASQLSTLLENDNLDSDDERMFEGYRRKRMEEMKKEEKRGRFGTVEPLGREDFVREVTEGSKVSPNGGVVGKQDEDEVEEDGEEDDGVGQGSRGRLRGTGVVVFLYKDSISLSQYLRPLLVKLAAAHPSTKFLSIPASLCIPNYPDKNVPTLLIYRNGDLLGNVVAGAGLNGMKTTVRELEGLLLRYKAIDGLSLALRAQRNGEDGDDADDGLEDEVATVNARGGGLRTGNGNAISRESDDSDFDM